MRQQVAESVHMSEVNVSKVLQKCATASRATIADP